MRRTAHISQLYFITLFDFNFLEEFLNLESKFLGFWTLVLILCPHRNHEADELKFFFREVHSFVILFHYSFSHLDFSGNISLKICIKAFTIGGAICTFGQFLNWGFEKMHFSEDAVKALTPSVLIVIAAILTGIGVFDKIAKHAGAGTIVPITGFANAIVSPAVEFKTDECDIIGLSRRASTSGEYDDLVQNHL